MQILSKHAFYFLSVVWQGKSENPIRGEGGFAGKFGFDQNAQHDVLILLLSVTREVGIFLSITMR